MECLVVVAHPDDEIIWMGGLMLRHPAWNWHIVSLCRAGDPGRAPRFHRVAEELGAIGLISDLDDSSPVLAPLSADLHEISQRVSSLVSRDFDLIFTHGAKGEYARHERHEQVHRAVGEMVESGELVGRLVFFAYEDCAGLCNPRPAADNYIRVELTDEEHAAKLRIIREIYGFGPGSFEFDACGPVEAFRTHQREPTPGQLQSAFDDSAR